MNHHDPKYNRFDLVHEMLETPGIIEKFDFAASGDAAAAIAQSGRLFLTGEGSSRIFPAKNLISVVLENGPPLAVVTEGARQAHEYDLSKFAVFGASNSGKTKELISLFTQLCRQCHRAAIRAVGQQSLHAGNCLGPLLHAPLWKGRRRGSYQKRRRAGPLLPLAYCRRLVVAGTAAVGGGRQGPRGVGGRNRPGA